MFNFSINKNNNKYPTKKIIILTSYVTDIKKLIDIAYNDAQTLLQEHREKLDKIALALLEKEKINEEEFKKFFNV